MIESLLVLLAVLALLVVVGTAWLFGTDQGWLRRHQRHGQIVVRYGNLGYENGGWSRTGSYDCPCGDTRDRKARTS